MHMDHAELNSPANAELISRQLKVDIPQNERDRQSHSKRAELNLILNHIEKKYGVLVSEIREKGEVSYLISPPARSKRVEARNFVVGRYSNEHMMRNFARYLNKGRLSRKNIDETIYEMKSLQDFC
ncbi:hypothetical protein NB640_11105 [Oxalobacter vibrioformis]|uniref:Uncharacterized protein n=1 Tax=Oxalobacter vibrioformis TaxID=933080 RepID=A0A9E9LY83_9BURK|nr:hypothetical protein [Oxalobacter vibrioformis]WAW09760.1 hypothetical protein NB640_11105 [Oxalobacter vibrioformis]